MLWCVGRDAAHVINQNHSHILAPGPNRTLKASLIASHVLADRLMGS